MSSHPKEWCPSEVGTVNFGLTFIQKAAVLLTPHAICRLQELSRQAGAAYFSDVWTSEPILAKRTQAIQLSSRKKLT